MLQVEPPNRKRYRTYHDTGEYELAIADFTKAVQLYPGVGVMFYEERASAYHEMGLYDLAIDDITKAIELCSEDHCIYMGELYLVRASIYRDIGEYDLALVDFDKSIELHPGYGVAKVYEDTHDGLIENVVEFYPENPFTYIGRSLLYATIGEFGLAHQDYERAVAVNYSAEYKYVESAIETYTKVIKAGSANAERYHFYLGYLYFKMGEYELALDSLTYAVELDPGNEAAYRLRADVYLDMGKYQLGAADLDRATELAIEAYTRALELNPNDLDSYVGRAEAHYLIGNHKLAIEDYTRAIELDPNNPDLYAARAWAYYGAGWYGRASSDN